MNQPSVYPFRIWFWLVPDRKGKLRKTRYRMTEAEAAARHAGAVKVEQDSMLILGPADPTSKFMRR